MGQGWPSPRHLPGKPRTIDGDDLNTGRSIGTLRFVSSIHDKCRLSIGARRIETPPILHARLEYSGKEIGTNRFSSLIPRGDWWHTQDSVFFQECHRPRDIICLLRMYVARKQRVLCCISTANLCHLSFIGGIVLLKRHPSAVQDTVHS
jgi:hypothetical protein